MCFNVQNFTTLRAFKHLIGHGISQRITEQEHRLQRTLNIAESDLKTNFNVRHCFRKRQQL